MIHRVFILRDKRNADALWGLLKQWPEFAKGKPLQVEVTEETTRRTTKQLKLYFARIDFLVEMSEIHKRPFDREQWHWFFKCKFLPDLDVVDGVHIPMSTRLLSSDEMTEYMQKIDLYIRETFDIEFLEVA